MGIKPTYIKKTGNALLKLHRDVFAADFEENKNLVSELTDIRSKRIRNRVAGYVTSKLKIKKVE